MKNNYLTFLLDSNICAVDITKVLEVQNFENLTQIPCSKPYIEGLIYSRGQGINVINLRKKFGLTTKETDKKTKIIVISVSKEVDDGFKETLYGLVADQVLDVQNLEDENTKEAKTSIPKENIEKILEHDGANIILLAFNDL